MEDLLKYELRVSGLSSMMIAYTDTEDELMDVIDSVQWIKVENRVGDLIWVNTDHVVAFWESDE